MEKVNPTVSAGIKATINLGDYNSFSVELKVDNVEPKEEETVPEALERTYRLLDKKVTEKLRKAADEFNS